MSMSSLCCCRGILSIFGVNGYPLDVVAQTKMDLAKKDRKKQTDYKTMSSDKSENNNGSVIRSELNNLSDASSASKTSRQRDRRNGRRNNSRSSRRSKKPRSFDESDSNSSVDSAEENLKVFRKSLRQSRSSRGSRATLNSHASKASHLHEKPQDSIADERYISASLSPSSLREYGSPLSDSLAVVHTSPPKSLSPEANNFRQSDNEVLAYVQDVDDEEYIESLRYPADSPHSLAKEETTVLESANDEPTTSRSSSARDLQRQRAVRKSPRGSPSMSLRSNKSLSPTYGSSNWAIGDNESIYRHEQHRAAGLSDEDEVNMAREASKSAERPLHELEEGESSARASEPISACGTLDVAIQYYLSEKKLQVTIIEAHDLPSKARGGSSIVQVRSVLLPAKKKKYKTKVQHISSPRFAETFKLTRASPEDLKGLALRLRMYGIGKLKDRLIGEAVIRFDELNLIRDPQLTIQLQLEPRTDINRVDSDNSLSNIDSRSSSMMSLSHGGNPPELLIGLSYNPPTGRLCVEVIKGSHFRNLAMTKPPDTLVKLSLLNSSCQEMSSSKTTIRRGQPNPVYKETFFFQVALFQLGEVTLMISVYNKRTIKKKEMIGWVSMGRNSSSEPDEQHWQEMKEGKGQQVCRWHTLIDT